MVERVSKIATEEFQEEYLLKSKPVIITDVTKNWSALHLWNSTYFKNKFGNARVGTMQLKGEKCDVDTYNESKRSKESVASIIDTSISVIEHPSSVIAAPVEDFPVSIQEDYTVPVYCAQGKFFRSRIYMGPKGVVTSLHQDLPENLYAVVKGTKRITLFYPSDRKYLYPNSFFSHHPNFSQTDPEKPDYKLFPDSENAHPLIVDITAGETLFIPSLWWHHLRNMEDSIAMNFWWSQGWKTSIAWGAAMYKKWMG